ncbi:Protein of unknown function [Mesobacillus persicus]|uniref:Sporulation protein YjcA n=1 Tax=Mesobacillus persicus TaxID=930146 RepID=A0A1H8E9E3_9BACI|nr:DUF1360 domain-containing protein [Mesobacillus persicus]SEN15724.1 Protein of unknown function [Mesobacillus persicus]
MFLGFGLESIIILGLASFRLTRLIVFDKITEFIRAPFFDEMVDGEEVYLVVKPNGIRRWVGELLNCYWCTGIWVSAALFISYFYLPVLLTPVILIFAIAAIASIIETIISTWLGE